MKRDFKNFEKKENMTKNTGDAYAYYSRVLKEPFDTLEDLVLAEEAYYAKIKAKEDKANAKKADAGKVEEAFKALNAARRAYKENLAALTERYSKDLKDLKAAFEKDKSIAEDLLASAEEAYSNVLKAFTDKYPEGYHLTLKDGDFETTISSNRTEDAKLSSTLADIFDILFN